LGQRDIADSYMRQIRHVYQRLLTEPEGEVHYNGESYSSLRNMLTTWTARDVLDLIKTLDSHFFQP
jgi:hypothetical protein